MEVYYFSGTGNSLHVAKEIRRRFPEAQLIPMVGLLGRCGLGSMAKTVGFVFPIHLTTLPRPVESFLREIDLESADYLFAVATRIGTFQVADLDISGILKRKNKKLDAYIVLNMAPNSPCGLVTPGFPGFNNMVETWVERMSEDKVQQLESEAQVQLTLIEECIANRLPYRQEGALFSRLGRLMAQLLMAAAKKLNRNTVIPFVADADCTGCGVCAEICPSGRVELAGKRPVWKQETPCYLCYGCFNACPEEAVLVQGRYERKDGRYLHPDVTAEELAAQKRA